MWLTILDYRKGKVICKEITEEIEDVEAYAKTITGHDDNQCVCTTMLIVEIDEIKKENSIHIIKN